MNSRILKPNQTVMIYANPMLKNDIGSGESVKLIKRDNEISEIGFLEYWLCKFITGKVKWVFVQPVLVIMLLLLSFNNFCQDIKTKTEWIKFVNSHRATGISINPGREGFGIFYMSKTGIKNSSIIATVSTGKFFEENIQGNKFGLGLSIPIQNFSLDLIPSYNSLAKKYPEDLSPISLEIGIHSKLWNIYPIIMIDPFLFIFSNNKKLDLSIYIGIPF